uniref:FHA domain-containing protein n=1 Tax=Graphocephala atropunctata TaxID=36148 RepID=A0A1B6KN53_9HEMI
MWLLRNDQKGLIYRVVSGKQHVVSRKDGDLLLVEDQSISRKHAQLFVDDENQNEGIVLKDLESKYGTFIIVGDGELTQLSPNQQITLKCGDSVRFGIQWNSWRVDYVPLLVATSTLTQEEKTEVRRLVTALGGEVVSDWQNRCTHLTMNKLTITVKVVCALAACQPIVMPTFWRSFAQALSSLQATLPNCQDFVPPLAEAVLNPSEVSFAPNAARSRLFNGLTFVASSPKQLNRIKSMVAAAGGEAVEFSARVWTEDKLMRDKIVLMQHSASDKQGSQNSQVPDGYLTVARKLRTQGVRCIPESEIGLGVLYCTVDQYCNPRYNARSVLGSSSSSLENTQRVNIICPDSEESTNSSENQNEINTVPRSPDQSTAKKRPHEDLSEDEEQTKKKPDTRGQSEDLFDSQVANTQPARSSSGSGSSAKASSPEDSSKSKAPVMNPIPSLDMFAPSGKSSSSHNQGEVRPSCEDLFNATGSRQTQNRLADADEFSFISKKGKPQKEVEDGGDEFAFRSKKNSVKQQDHVQDDEFSFASTKRSSKRNRDSDADMFASSNESPLNKSTATPSLKVRRVTNEEEFRLGEKKPSAPKDNVFVFPEKPKRKRKIESLVDEEEAVPEVKVAVYSKEEPSVAGSSSSQAEKEVLPVENIAGTKDWVIYSKLNPALANIKKEVDDEEVDKLAKELHNTTIVVVKSLVVARKKPVETSTAAAGKNFKKFRKVVGINKRAVPHIIGGSDLVPYNADDVELADELVPNHLTPQADEWGFQSNRNRGVTR